MPHTANFQGPPPIDHVHVEEHSSNGEHPLRRLLWILIAAVVVCLVASLFNRFGHADPEPPRRLTESKPARSKQWVSLESPASLVFSDEEDTPMPLTVRDRGYMLRATRSQSDAMQGELICTSHGRSVGNFRLTFAATNLILVALQFADGTWDKIELAPAK